MAFQIALLLYSTYSKGSLAADHRIGYQYMPEQTQTVSWAIHFMINTLAGKKITVFYLTDITDMPNNIPQSTVHEICPEGCLPLVLSSCLVG